VKPCANACGDCRRCRLIDRALKEAKRDKAMLRQALVLLDAARWEMAAELHANGPEEVRQHPQLRVKVGLVARIEKLIGQWSKI
jgi:hypothetical protein